MTHKIIKNKIENSLHEMFSKVKENVDVLVLHERYEAFIETSLQSTQLKNTGMDELYLTPS